MDRFGNGEEFTMERTLKTEKDGLSFQDFDKKLFTGKVMLMVISYRLELSMDLNVFYFC
jgi:exonuclease-1